MFVYSILVIHNDSHGTQTPIKCIRTVICPDFEEGKEMVLGYVGTTCTEEGYSGHSGTVSHSLHKLLLQTHPEF